LTTQVAVPPQVALEESIGVPTYIESNHQMIIAGVSPPHKPSADKKKHIVSTVSQLTAGFTAFKQSLVDGQSNQYGTDTHFSEAPRPLYRDWLALRSQLNIW
jgi:hypothetical protein